MNDTHLRGADGRDLGMSIDHVYSAYLLGIELVDQMRTMSGHDNLACLANLFNGIS
jgi:hypothetical protein